jgi:hypothetical protein
MNSKHRISLQKIDKHIGDVKSYLKIIEKIKETSSLEENMKLIDE